jgi:hypothetical protein
MLNNSNFHKNPNLRDSFLALKAANARIREHFGLNFDPLYSKFLLALVLNFEIFNVRHLERPSKMEDLLFAGLNESAGELSNPNLDSPDESAVFEGASASLNYHSRLA